MFAWLRKRGIDGASDTKLALRAITVDATPFRATTTPEAAEPPARAAEPRPLADVIAAIVTLQPKPLRKGFELPGTEPGKVLRAFVSDPRRVTPDTLDFVTNQAEMLIDLAHALVPLFGAIGADFGSAGWLIIDGTRSVAAIRTELSDRYKAMLQHMMGMMEPLRAMLDTLRVKISAPGTLEERPRGKPDDPEHR